MFDVRPIFSGCCPQERLSFIQVPAVCLLQTAELYVLNDEYTRQGHLTTVTDNSSVAATEL